MNRAKVFAVKARLYQTLVDLDDEDLTTEDIQVLAVLTSDIELSGFFKVLARAKKNPAPKVDSDPIQEEPQEHIHEMGLCESRQVYLRPNRLYRFVAYTGCKQCQELAMLLESTCCGRHLESGGESARVN